MNDLTDEFSRALGRIEGKIELLLTGQATRNIETDARFQRVEARVSKVETKTVWAYGVGAGVATAIGGALALVKLAIGAH